MEIIDLHGCSVEMAKKEVVKQAAALSHKHKEMCFEVIHGYNSGSKIKQMLLQGFKCKYIRKILPDPYNEGRSLVWINF